MRHLLNPSCIAIGTLLSLASCINGESVVDADGTRATMVELSLTVPLSSVEVGEGYENGNTYENSISNYRIYFYDYYTNTYITRLSNVSISTADTDLNTRYTITGMLSSDDGKNPLSGVRDFKVVMLANWGTYTEPQAGSTIDDLCNSGTFSASTYFAIDKLAYIPFYGVHAYTDITLATDGTTNQLPEPLTLLRAVAKVEVLLTNDRSEDVDFDDVSIVHYNSLGYCAPTGVYSQTDYGQPTTWTTDYVSTLHLVDDRNDRENSGGGARTVAFNEDADATMRTWTIYLPEYDNSGTDYSYLQITTQDGETHNVYFAEYVDGETDAYSGGSSERWNIRRNNLYRYYVTVEGEKFFFRVNVRVWEYQFDNEYTFGEEE